MENMSNKHSLIQKTSVEFQRETEMLTGGLNTLYPLPTAFKLCFKEIFTKNKQVDQFLIETAAGENDLKSQGRACDL
jgi:hypothetical protein